MEQKYETIQMPTPDITALKRDLIEQRNTLERRIKRLDDKETRDKLQDSLEKIKDISESLIPLQESLNIIWKRTHQVEESIKDLVEQHS